MTTLFDPGDEIEVTIRGKVRSFSIERNGDCYVVVTDEKGPGKGTALYFDGETLKGAKLIRKAEKNNE